MKCECEVTRMELKLVVDGKEIPLNDFVSKLMAGSIVGAVTSLKGIREDWKKIEVEISK
jgi:hypothetical protein